MKLNNIITILVFMIIIIISTSSTCSAKYVFECTKKAAEITINNV